jgi:hypothetical protein
MRKPILLVSLTALAACSGGGPETAGGSAVVGGGTTNNNNSSNHSFVAPTEKKTYSAIGGVQHYQYSTDSRNVANQYNQLYAGNASTARNSGITISYDPRDAIFELTIADSAAAVNRSTRFQDPAHRTDFGGDAQPQGGTPNIPGKGILYLQNGSTIGQPAHDPSQTQTDLITGQSAATADEFTFFYQKPGTTTKYVTFAGWVRNQTGVAQITNPDNSTYLRQTNTLERAAFAFGERTDNGSVPKTGTASYTGDMLATMVYNPLIDVDQTTPTYYQWINGSATTNVDFGGNSFTTSMTGTVGAPMYDAYTSQVHVLDAGATFAASGSGAVDLVNKGGFAGQVGTASFTQNGTNIPVAIAGSSIDGAFYGPHAEEVGGGFRIVGGTPDERIDVLGAFTGKKP